MTQFILKYLFCRWTDGTNVRYFNWTKGEGEDITEQCMALVHLEGIRGKLWSKRTLSKLKTSHNRIKHENILMDMQASVSFY